MEVLEVCNDGCCVLYGLRVVRIIYIFCVFIWYIHIYTYKISNNFDRMNVVLVSVDTVTANILRFSHIFFLFLYQVEMTLCRYLSMDNVETERCASSHWRVILFLPYSNSVTTYAFILSVTYNRLFKLSTQCRSEKTNTESTSPSNSL